MLYRLLFMLTFALIGFCSCKTQFVPSDIYTSDNLIIQKISPRAYIHISYLNTESFGKVACNGLVFIDQQEAIIIDTPSDQASSIELIKWIETIHNSKIKAVVVTHFHEDCLGGLNEFHKKQIPSFSNQLTRELVKSNNRTIPQIGFETIQNITIGDETIINEYLGEGHTKDNIICYIPSEKILFGGCLIKALGGGKGNLDDANTNEWSNTVEKVKYKYGNSKTVVPGHGKCGGINLLDYTIEMFRN